MKQLVILIRIKPMFFNYSNRTEIGKLNQTKEVLVNWHYNIDDTDMYSSGVRFSKLINIPFEFTELK